MTTWLPTDALEDLPVLPQDGVAADGDPKAEQAGVCHQETVSRLGDRFVSILTTLTTLAAGAVVLMTGVGLVLRVVQQAGLLRSLLG